MTALRKQISEPATALPHFREEALRFLRGLKRNNRREWFEERRSLFEREVKAPMLALIETVTHGMIDYAPSHIRDARRTLLRIYRDTRFSSDKSPYKQHIAAWWGADGMEKTSGAGYYLHLSGTELILAAGVFMPTKDQLLAIRRHLLAHHDRFRSLLEDRALRRKFEPHDPLALTRVPKGFPADHPAAEYLRWRQWGVHVTLPAATALDPKFPGFVQQHFALAAPLVDFLHRALDSARGTGKSTRKIPLAPLY
jgi:uncharacterized protein (TIGR02453 family)